MITPPLHVRRPKLQERALSGKLSYQLDVLFSTIQVLKHSNRNEGHQHMEYADETPSEWYDGQGE